MKNKKQIHTFRNQAAQGDLYFRRVKEIPATAKAAPKFDGIVAHSETGHHHKFAKTQGLTYYTTNDPTVAYLRVESASCLDHHRPFDTHESFMFDVGTYELRRPVEYVSASEKRIVQD
jgi:hypothetical protein